MTGERKNVYRDGGGQSNQKKKQDQSQRYDSGNQSHCSGNYQGGGKKQNQEKAQPQDLPKGYLDGGYYRDEEKENLNPDYIITYAKNIAEALEAEGGNECNKRTQIRKFYEYLLRVRDKMDQKNGKFEYVEAELMELQPKANYACSRKVVSAIYVKFIEKNLEHVKDASDMWAFVKHFEAVIAYMKKGN